MKTDKKYDVWEKEIFLKANHYSVVVFEGTQMGSLKRGTAARFDYDSYLDALKWAQKNPRSVLYANTEDQQSAPLPKEKWEMYKCLWQQARNFKED